MNDLAVRALLGQEGVWAVGGAVRDWALGRPSKDLDIAVKGDVRRTGGRLAAATGGHFFLMHAASQTARVAYQDGSWVDLVPLPFGLEADLWRRDFTVNAMAAPVALLLRPAAATLPDSAPDGIVDPTGGWADLRASRVRLTRGAALHEDPLRTLRGLRLCAALGFSMEPDTRAAIASNAGRLALAAPERIRDEWLAMLDTGKARNAIARAVDLGLLDVILPEWREMEGVTQNLFHHLDVWEHTLDVIYQFDALQSRQALEPPLRLPDDLREPVAAYLSETITAPHTRRALMRHAMLLHDTGKPATRTEDEDGRIRFHGHERTSAGLAREWAARFRLSAKERDFLAAVVGLHMRPGALIGPDVTTRAVTRFFRDAGPSAPALLLLNAADRLAARGPWTTDDEVVTQVEGSWGLLRQWVEMKNSVALPLPVSGRDLMAAYGLAPGPHVGRLIQRLRYLHADAPFSDKAAAIEAAAQMIDTEDSEDAEAALE